MSNLLDRPHRMLGVERVVVDAAAPKLEASDHVLELWRSAQVRLLFLGALARTKSILNQEDALQAVCFDVDSTL